MDASVEVYLKADEVWKYFQMNKEALKSEQVLVAENTETKYEIYLTDFAGHPQLRVFRGDIELHTECCIDEEDCTYTAKWIYVKYLFPVTANTSKQYGQSKIPVDDKPKAETKKETQKSGAVKAMEDIICEREDELAQAASDFLEIVLEYFGAIEEYYGEGLIEDTLDHVCQRLAKEWGISVRRPFMYEDDDGKNVFEEYPYLPLDDMESDLADVN